MPNRSLFYVKIVQGEQQFIGLIGGRVFNPRQQQNALNIYNMLLPRVKNPPPN